MKAKLFTAPENINWPRWWFLVSLVTTVWLGLVTIVPMNVFRYVSVPLVAVQTGLAFAARSTKYVTNRNLELPPDGKT